MASVTERIWRTCYHLQKNRRDHTNPSNCYQNKWFQSSSLSEQSEWSGQAGVMTERQRKRKVIISPKRSHIIMCRKWAAGEPVSPVGLVHPSLGENIIYDNNSLTSILSPAGKCERSEHDRRDEAVGREFTYRNPTADRQRWRKWHVFPHLASLGSVDDNKGFLYSFFLQIILMS